MNIFVPPDSRCHSQLQNPQSVQYGSHRRSGLAGHKYLRSSLPAPQGTSTSHCVGSDKKEPASTQTRKHIDGKHRHVYTQKHTETSSSIATSMHNMMVGTQRTTPPGPHLKVSTFSLEKLKGKSWSETIGYHEPSSIPRHMMPRNKHGFWRHPGVVNSSSPPTHDQ